MGQVIRFTNKFGEIELNNKKPFLLVSIDGFSEISSTPVTSRGVNQDGENFNYSKFDKRPLLIKFSILADTKEELMQLRNTLIKIFNPKIESTLYYTYAGVERKITCIAENTPAIELIGNKLFCDGEVSLIAYNPFFTDILDSGEEISTWIGGWKFKFKLPFRFKQKGEPKKNIYNSGHVDTPVEVIFKGPALNPSIINNTTGEFIKVDRELTSDDILYISTEFGNKKVEIERNGERLNAFHYIDLDSTFFELITGDNLIEYTTENKLEPQSVEIRYKNRYIGV